MSISSKPKTYRYKFKCKSCKKYARILNHYCQICGLINGSIVTNDPGIKHFVVCSKCRGQINPKILPSHCPSCQKEKLNWWDLKSKRWFLPSLKPSFANEEQTLWLKGEFDGDLIGEYIHDSRHEGSNKGSRSFNAKFLRGILKNVEAVENPPNKVFASENVIPLRQDVVKDVLVSTGSSFASISLHDFRLHNWIEIHDDELTSDKTFSRIQGIAYGCVNPSENQLDALAGDQIEKQLRPLPPPPPPKAEPAPPKAKINGNTTKPLDTKPKQNFEFGLDKGFSKTNNAENISKSECIFCKLLPRLLMAFLVFIVCNLYSASVAFLSVSLFCLIDSSTYLERYKFKKEKIRNFTALILIGISLYFLIELSDSINELGCVKLLNKYTLIILVCFLLSSLLYKCLPKFILCVIWIVSLLLACSEHGSNCMAHHKLSHQISSLAHNPNNVLNDLSKIGSSNINNDTNKSDNNNDTNESNKKDRELTLSEVLDKPDLLNDCHNKLYLPFAFDSSILDQYSEDTLNELKAALDKIEDNRRLIVTGHTDAHGDETIQGFAHNIQLSERRASAVAEWLYNHGSKFKQDSIDVRGMGSKYPVDESNLLSPFNRRVEIQLTCPLVDKQ